MSTVKDVLDFKGRDLWSIDQAQSIYDATSLMEERHVGSLAVFAPGVPLAGIVSERDCARATILRGLSASETPISEVMTSDVIAVNETTLVDQCMHLMSHHHIRHLPVTSGRNLVGIVSGSDIMKSIVRDQSMTIEALESFMHDDEGGEG